MLNPSRADGLNESQLSPLPAEKAGKPSCSMAADTISFRPEGSIDSYSIPLRQAQTLACAHSSDGLGVVRRFDRPQTTWDARILTLHLFYSSKFVLSRFNSNILFQKYGLSRLIPICPKQFGAHWPRLAPSTAHNANAVCVMLFFSSNAVCVMFSFSCFYFFSSLLCLLISLQAKAEFFETNWILGQIIVCMGCG